LRTRLTIVNIESVRVELSEEQEFLREAVAGVLAREATPALVRDWAEARDTSAADALAARQGWTGIGLSEDLGGQGGGIVELAITAEELGRAATPWDRLLGGCLGLTLLAAAPADAAAQLAGASAEAERCAILCTDGQRVPAPWPNGVLDGSELTLSADYVPGGAAATELVVAVDAGEGPRLLSVATDSPAVTVTPRPLVDHTRSLAAVELRGAAALDLGTIPAEAFARAGAAAAVLVAADALGAAARLLEMTVEYVADRRQFGVPVGSFQAVKHAAAEMLVDVEASRSAVRYAAWAVDSATDDDAVWASIAKIHAGSAAPRVADKALFLHGAIGYTWEHDLQFAFKRTKSDEKLFGSPDQHRDRIAESLALEQPSTAALARAG
jgi:alkylation response protein AidB-like acyl-CoA dehydrogenase